MTDTVKSWIEEHRAIHAAATEGPWEHGVKPFRGDIGHNVSSPERVVMFGGFESISPTAEADSVAVVDAHNVTVPTALSMVEAVLKVHWPMPDGNCASCTWFSDDNIIAYPCPTVRALEGVIDDE